MEYFSFIGRLTFSLPYEVTNAVSEKIKRGANALMPTFDRPQYTPEQEQQAKERKEVLKRINARGLLASAVNGGNIIEVEQIGLTVFHTADGEPNGEYFINGYYDAASGLGVFVNSVTARPSETRLMVGVGYAEGYTLHECILHAAAMARMSVGEVGACTGNLVDGGIEQIFYEDTYSGKKYNTYYAFDQIKTLTEEKLQNVLQNKGQVWQAYEKRVVERQAEDERGKTEYSPPKRRYPGEPLGGDGRSMRGNRHADSGPYYVGGRNVGTWVRLADGRIEVRAYNTAWIEAG